MKLYIFFFFFGSCLTIAAQATLEFPVDDINSLIQNGSCQVTHSEFDIGSIYDVFDRNAGTLARSANINPLVVTLSFPFQVNFSGSEIIHQGGEGWWSIEVADTEEDLASQTGSYVLLFSMSPVIDNILTSQSFPLQSKKIIRMTVRRTTGDDYVHLTEWQLSDARATVDIVSLCARPSQVWLKPQTSFDVFLSGNDESGLSYPITMDVDWSIENATIASISFNDGHATVSSFDKPGSTSLSIQWNGLEESIPVKVADDFLPKTAPTRVVKVILVIIDPRIDAEGGLRFHERFGWDDPVSLTYALRDSLNAAGGGAIDYEIINVYDELKLYANFQGTFISVDSMYRLFLEPGWTTFHQLEQLGGSIQFDYNGLLEAHDFCAQSNMGELDEIWVYSMPFTGMYESRLTGEGAFWYNSPPLDGNSCINQLPVMGFNYERGVAEALHSFGHRVESAMVHTFGRWDYNASDKNDWEKFSSYDEVVPGEAYCGNIHFPPNGISDYDYENNSDVTIKAENFNQYPFLFDIETTANCEEWGCSHLGFMSWWFHHLPHFSCKNKNGILNNWWSYIVDYNEGRLLEKVSSACECEYVESSTSVKEKIKFASIQVFPNPGSGIFYADIKLLKPHPSRLDIYDSTGVRVDSYDLEGKNESIRIDLTRFSEGVYYISIHWEDGLSSISEPVVLIEQ